MVLPERKCGVSQCAAMAVAVLILGALTCLTGCNSSTPSHTIVIPNTTAAAVVDSANNRLLIYNYPLSSNGQNANIVLGQGGLTTSGAALSPTGMNAPFDAAEDSSGNLYVSDINNNRILQFKPPFSNGMAASLAIGQPSGANNLTTGEVNDGDANPTQSGLYEPFGLAFDGSGDLWVADAANSRILEYQPPFTAGMAASLVIGQSNFTSGTPATTQSGLSFPYFIAFDGNGDLWVADNDNNRVLEFRPPFTDGMMASLVIGQSDFTSAGADGNTNPDTISASGLHFPSGIAFDTSGNLWVSDRNNNRVLQFKPSFHNGMTASLVLGQTAFNTNTSPTPPTQNSFDLPLGISFDSTGNLLVADGSNNRLLEFSSPSSNGQNSSLVLGQSSFTTDAAPAPPTAASQNLPFSVRPLF